MWKNRLWIALLLAFALCVVFENFVLQGSMVTTVSKEVKPEEEKIVFLTFDDGPSKVTEQVLDILKEEQICASFFLIGKQIDEKTEKTVLRMKEEGHLIGVHTYCHEADKIYKSVDAYIEDIEKAEDVIMNVTGEKPVYYRFPWGSVNCYVSPICDEIKEQMKEKGYTYFDWNVSAEDSIGKPSVEKILSNVRKDYMKYHQPVILLHDSEINENTAKALKTIIKELKEGGYQFGTIDKRNHPYQYRK